mmetsp:Transcript_15548/g.33883  ORF Transcript_15548/g.33883 Transcript_15548/m.33883 type:complete len:267 (-) Transcript_15548:978-1778(-)
MMKDTAIVAVVAIGIIIPPNHSRMQTELVGTNPHRHAVVAPVSACIVTILVQGGRPGFGSFGWSQDADFVVVNESGSHGHGGGAMLWLFGYHKGHNKRLPLQVDIIILVGGPVRISLTFGPAPQMLQKELSRRSWRRRRCCSQFLHALLRVAILIRSPKEARKGRLGRRKGAFLLLLRFLHLSWTPKGLIRSNASVPRANRPRKLYGRLLCRRCSIIVVAANPTDRLEFRRQRCTTVTIASQTARPSAGGKDGFINARGASCRCRL